MAKRKTITQFEENPDSTEMSEIDEEIEQLENLVEKRKRLTELRKQARILDIMNGETKTLKYITRKRGLGDVYRRVYTLYDPDTLEPMVREATLELPLGQEVNVRADVAEQILKKVHDTVERIKKDPTENDIQPWIIEVPKKG